MKTRGGIVQVKRSLNARSGPGPPCSASTADSAIDDVVDPSAGRRAVRLRRRRSRRRRTVGNRFAVLPMEGWDGDADGLPTDLVRRRWRRFGESGAKLVWGGEAVAVRHDGRANPCQLVIASDQPPRRSPHCAPSWWTRTWNTTAARDDLVIGLQLTHSGRFARPDEGAAPPLIAYHHPVLDARLAHRRRAPLLTDDDLDALCGDFVSAAVLAADRGLRLRRRQALPRLSPARAARRGRPSRPLRR